MRRTQAARAEVGAAEADAHNRREAPQSGTGTPVIYRCRKPLEAPILDLQAVHAAVNFPSLNTLRILRPAAGAGMPRGNLT